MKTIRIILGVLLIIPIVLGLNSLITHPESASVWGDVATWVTGLTTVALFIIGFIQIRNERMTRVKAEQDLEKKTIRDQAERISCWFEKQTGHPPHERQWIAIMNQSNQPIYSVIVSMVGLTQWGKKYENIRPHRACVDLVPPGLGYTSVEAIEFGHPGMSRAGVEIAFKDILGTNWLRMPDGELMQLEQSSIEFYNITLPAPWGGIEKELPQDNH